MHKRLHLRHAEVVYCEHVAVPFLGYRARSLRRRHARQDRIPRWMYVFSLSNRCPLWQRVMLRRLLAEAVNAKRRSVLLRPLAARSLLLSPFVPRNVCSG